MKNEPIICSGEELDGVLSAIRDRGGFVASLETGVGKHNASYRVNYFESVAEKPTAGGSEMQSDNQMMKCLGSDSHNSVRESGAGDNPAALNHLDAVNRPMTSAGKSPRGSDQVTPEELRAEKLQSGVERQIESRVEDCQQHSLSIESPLPHCPTCSGRVTQAMPCPICAGIERIRDGARRLRNRFKSSTMEARLPHPND